jgi:hypothetical protein
MKWASLVVLFALGCASETEKVGESPANGGTGGSIGLAGGGAGGSAGAGGGAGGSPSGGSAGEPQCYSAPSQSVPDCAAFELCMTAAPDVYVAESNCTDQCSLLYEPNAQGFSYEDDRVMLFLGFGNWLSQNPTTDELRAAFQGGYYSAKFPLEEHGAEYPKSADYFVPELTLADFDVMEVLDGRLHVKLSFQAKDPRAQVLSTQVYCGDTNLCYCTFSGFETDGSIELDLPIAGL